MLDNESKWFTIHKGYMVVYQAEFKYNKEKEEFSLIRTMPDGTSDTAKINSKEILELEKNVVILNGINHWSHPSKSE
jgi:hypothetical protein